MLYASSNTTANCNFLKSLVQTSQPAVLTARDSPRTSTVLKLKFRAPQKTECNDWHQLQKKKKKKFLLLVNILVCYAARCTVHPQASYC